jgi:hypothetical protein
MRTGKGWRNEPLRHSLARKGVKTGRKVSAGSKGKPTNYYASQLNKLSKSDTIQVIGRRWFDRVYGNTYHVVDVYVNNKHVGSSPITYGYDDAYKQTARDILVSKGFLKESDRPIPLWTLRNEGVSVLTSVNDVTRKKDL